MFSLGFVDTPLLSFVTFCCCDVCRLAVLCFFFHCCKYLVGWNTDTSATHGIITFMHFPVSKMNELFEWATKLRKISGLLWVVRVWVCAHLCTLYWHTGQLCYSSCSFGLQFMHFSSSYGKFDFVSVQRLGESANAKGIRWKYANERTNSRRKDGQITEPVRGTRVIPEAKLQILCKQVFS